MITFLNKKGAEPEPYLMHWSNFVALQLHEYYQFHTFYPSFYILDRSLAVTVG